MYDLILYFVILPLLFRFIGSCLMGSEGRKDYEAIQRRARELKP